MNTLDQNYQELLRDILLNGVVKETRNGGTISVFGRQIRHNMREGFPLLTSKKMATKQIITELLWFLRGETNIQSLVQDGNYIWVGDAYKAYSAYAGSLEEPDYDVHIDDPVQNKTRIMTRKEFIEQIKTDDEFAKRWGELGPVYGKQWRKWTKPEMKYSKKEGIPIGIRIEHIDQIAEMMGKLQSRPDDRRNMVTAWNPAEVDAATLPPCHYGFQVWTRELSLDERFDYWFNNSKPNRDTVDDYDTLSDEEKYERLNESNVPKRAISLMWNQRSCDTPLGIPFNIASYGALLQILAQLSNMIPEELIGNLGDTHIYLNQTEGVIEQIERRSHELPTLKINTEGITDPAQLKFEDFELLNYVSEGKIEFPLSN